MSEKPDVPIKDPEREKYIRLELQKRMEEHSLLESDLVPFEEASMYSS
jgi:hypothetical protein